MRVDLKPKLKFFCTILREEIDDCVKNDVRFSDGFPSSDWMLSNSAFACFSSGIHAVSAIHTQIGD